MATAASSEKGTPSQVSSGEVVSVASPWTWNLNNAPGRSSRYTSHVALDHLVAGDVLEDDGRKGEVEHALAEHRKILPVVLIDERVGPVGQGAASLADHLA